MTTKLAYTLKAGQKLKLKPARAVAYGMSDPVVTFIGLHNRPPYSTPLIMAHYGVNNILGYFACSDF